MSYFTGFRSKAYSSGSEVSSPDQQSPFSDCDDVNTPDTEISVLFDENDSSFAFREPVNDEHILVVGGCGYIGSHTVWELAKAGYNVCIVYHLSKSFFN